MTLEEDLSRRDLTINAIARDEQGNFVDPFDGRRDLAARLLRHVSPAFAEDPVRILRVARFAARFAPLGFRVAPQTLALMRAMVTQGEASALVAERVWQETDKALRETRASEFVRVLRECGALQIVFPELDALFGVPQPVKWHPEIDTGVHVLMVLDQAAQLSCDPKVRFAALVHDLGKGLTPPAEWPSHKGHEEKSVELIEALCARLRVPADYRELALIVARHHGNVHRAFELKASTVLEMLERSDAFRRGARFEQALIACEADSRGRAGLEAQPYPQRLYLQCARDAAAAVKPTQAEVAGQPSAKIGESIRRRRIEAIETVKQSAPSASS